MGAVWVVRQRIEFDMGVSDMAQVEAQQSDGDVEEYKEARRRAWMEEYWEERREEAREERRREAREENCRTIRRVLAGLATRRFGPQVGRRLAEVLADAEDVAHFARVSELIRSLDAESR